MTANYRSQLIQFHKKVLHQQPFQVDLSIPIYKLNKAIYRPLVTFQNMVISEEKWKMANTHNLRPSL